MKAGERVARSLIQELGLQMQGLRQNGRNHLCFDVLTPGGKQFTAIFAHTPSDRRGILNQRSWMRRRIRELDHGN